MMILKCFYHVWTWQPSNLVQWRWTIRRNCQYPFDRRTYVKYCENCSLGFREENIKKKRKKKKKKKKLEPAVDGAPSHIPTLVAYIANSMTDGWTLSHTFTMRGGQVASLVKFRLVVLKIAWRSGVWTPERRSKIILLSDTLTMRESEVASLVEFRPAL